MSSGEGKLFVIDEVEFGILSPEEIRKIGKVKLSTPQIYDEDGRPVRGGPLDPRMGVIEPGEVCQTCGNTLKKCPGHFGVIELARPVLHIAFTKYIYQALASTCMKCKRVLLPKEECERLRKLVKEGKKTPLEVAKIVYNRTRKVKECPHCGTPVKKIKFTPPLTFYLEDETTRLWPNDIRAWLEDIRDEDCILVGFDPKNSRPENTVLTVILVPPITIRPSITLETGEKSEDDLTHKLVDILRANISLKEAIQGGAPASTVEDHMYMLEINVGTLYRNTGMGIPLAVHRTKRPLKALMDRWQGKTGRFRLNLVGKRVNYSSRTVITPDTMIDLDEVGVPISIAKVLTIPVHVTESNIEEVKELVKRGADEHPGANYVIRPTGDRVKISSMNKDRLIEELEPGYVVERHLRDGDPVIFNRHPSLHRLSILGHRVRVLPYNSFTLHPAVCPPYNADFDGDEMNVHAPQLFGARVEVSEILNVKNNMLSPRFGGAIVGPRQDYITSLYKLTRKDRFLTKAELGRILATLEEPIDPPEPAILEPIQLWTGKQAVSVFIPEDIDHEDRASVCEKCDKEGGVCEKELCPYEAYVVIKRGQLLWGVLDSRTIGAMSEEHFTLLDKLIRDLGGEKSSAILSKLLKAALKPPHSLVSLRIEDIELPSEHIAKIERMIEESRREAVKIAERLRKEELEPIPGMSLEDTAELQIVRTLNSVRTRAEKLVRSTMTMRNSLYMMAKTKARGSPVLLTEMAALVGQQSIKGKRISRGYKGRTLSCYRRGATDPEARGFIRSSYRKGLTPSEYFAHAIAGRETLVDKGLRTAESGYAYRRIVNALQDLTVDYDWTVRDSHGRIIQFKFGGDGLDPCFDFHGNPINVHKIVREEAEEHKNEKKISSKQAEKIIDEYREVPEWIRRQVKNEVERVELSEAAIRGVMDRVFEAYDKIRLEPGSAIGIVSAESIGEPATQLTLRTFHTPGMPEITIVMGLPRIAELIDAVKTPKSPYVVAYLKGEYARDKKKAQEVANRILEAKLSDLIEEENIYYELMQVEYVLDVEKLREHNLTVEDVEKALSKISKVSVERTGDKSILITIQADSMAKMRAKLIKVENTVVKGIPGAKRVVVKEENGENVIHIEGAVLKQVLELEEIDTTRTYSSNVHEVIALFGIEAGRNLLVEELSKVLSNQGIVVDRRHLELLADIMTRRGELLQVGRLGVVKYEKGVLANASYELTVQNIVKAAVSGKRDKIGGVLESIIVGRAPEVGEAIVKVFWGEPS